MHCADISNPTKPFKVYEKWVHRVMSEFWAQGDEERRLGLKISPFMDRQNKQVAKCQVGFIQFIVRPLFDAFTELVVDELRTEIMENLDVNQARWEARRDEQLQAEAEADEVVVTYRDEDDAEANQNNQSALSVTKIGYQTVNNGSEIVFTADSSLVINVNFPAFLLKILPTNKDKAEESGSKSITRVLEKDVKASLKAFQKAYLEHVS